MEKQVGIAKLAILLGAFYGASGVILGAFGAHALKNKLSPEFLNSYTTATKYQIYHALLLVFIGGLIFTPLFQANNTVYFKWCIYFLSLGILLFSGSIYLLTLFHLKSVALLTPIGGLLLIVAWGLLSLAIIKVN